MLVNLSCRSCYVTVDSSIAVSQKGACTFRCVPKPKRDIMILFYNNSMINDEKVRKFLHFLWGWKHIYFSLKGKLLRPKVFKINWLQLPDFKKHPVVQSCSVLKYIITWCSILWRRHCKARRHVATLHSPIFKGRTQHSICSSYKHLTADYRRLSIEDLTFSVLMPDTLYKKVGLSSCQ